MSAPDANIPPTNPPADSLPVNESPLPAGAGTDALPAAQVSPLADAGPSVNAAPAPPAGPGLFESLLWLAGIFPAQIAGVVAMLAILLLQHHAALPPAGDPIAFSRHCFQLLEANPLAVLGGAQVMCLVYAAVAISWRLRPQGWHALGLHAPRAAQVLLIVLSVLPLSLLGSEIQQRVTVWIPGADLGMQSMMQELSSSSLLALLLVIAVCPALSEELLFRGFVGRGLIHRWGVVAGVCVTSLLFGLIHVNPAQAIAVVPLGLAMHFVYLMTRSIWAPILLHFLNNSWAVVALKYSDSLEAAAAQGPAGSLPAPLMTVSLTMLTAAGLLLWQTRIQPATRTVEQPSAAALPPGPGTQSSWLGLTWTSSEDFVSQPPAPLLLACGAFNLVGFLTVLWQLTTPTG